MKRDLIRLVIGFILLSSIGFSGVTVVGGGWTPSYSKSMNIGEISLGEYGGDFTAGEGEDKELTLETNTFIVSGGSLRVTYKIYAEDGEFENQVLARGIRCVPYSTPSPDYDSGSIYFDSDDNHFYGYNGTAWVQLDN
ncbi:hypothetical protein DRJ22_06160 [Candidatus Woesearchaeota archaeon]|nr:MAG: hypothetical protein DRJ22_06160 [Candidatus Woesearchaeota archaeon]